MLDVFVYICCVFCKQWRQLLCNTFCVNSQISRVWSFDLSCILASFSWTPSGIVLFFKSFVVLGVTVGLLFATKWFLDWLWRQRQLDAKKEFQVSQGILIKRGWVVGRLEQVCICMYHTYVRVYVYIDIALVRCLAFHTIIKIGDIYHQMCLEKLAWTLECSKYSITTKW